MLLAEANKNEAFPPPRRRKGSAGGKGELRLSDETVIRCCAPTLARIKTGSLFNCSFASQAEMVEAMIYLNRELRGKGVRAIPLRWQGGKCLIYLYRPPMLERDLRQPRAVAMLRECGYRSTRAEACLTELIHRLRSSKDFPHEIGLFLGYPPADVDGFIHHRVACGCKGLWKVYEDEEGARRLFDRYRRCTEEYLQQLGRGYGLSRLCVGAGRSA